ncbi:MAG: hypothetical protein HDT22_10445 [Ruminococcus sp.]|nr:hypothetical protein [Ruminococcus sp.]
MAKRPAFCISDHKIIQKNFDFIWYSGFALSQKQKCIASLHAEIIKKNPCAKPLEISTKSKSELGAKLSAFQLQYQGHSLENIFQSSKVFEHGGAYQDLLTVSPKEAKRDSRLRNSGKLTGFLFDNILWELEPKTAFYDYIYLKSVKDSLEIEEIQQIADYDYFTDIEFNPEKSINTQARSVAILKLLLESFGELPDFTQEEFLKFHKNYVLD